MENWKSAQNLGTKWKNTEFEGEKHNFFMLKISKYSIKKKA